MWPTIFPMNASSLSLSIAIVFSIGKAPARKTLLPPASLTNEERLIIIPRARRGNQRARRMDTEYPDSLYEMKGWRADQGRPMILLRRPQALALTKFLASQASLDLTYSAVGATAATPPARFVVDHTRAKIGKGQAAFNQAKAALCRWDQFRLGWLEAYSPRDVIQPGNPVALFARRAGLWWLNACRVIYVIDEPGPVHRYGYAYGTLPDHAASGEERFLVEWNPADNVVWYDILAFSRPRNLLSRLGYRYMRRIQKQFGKDSAAVMMRSVSGTGKEGLGE